MLLNTPWTLTASKLRSHLLFHGSIEPWRTSKPHAGGYDSVFWTTEDPLTAQTYIPDWGVKTLIGVSSYELPDQVRPEPTGVRWAIAKELGAAAEILEVKHDRVTSWRNTGATVTYQDLLQRVHDMGYAPNEENQHWVKTFSCKVGDAWLAHPLPANTLPFGRLVLIDPPEDLRILDKSEGAEPDLIDVQYHDLTGFSKAFSAGFDGVKINDFAQSPKMGNVGHTSTGFSCDAIGRMHKDGRIRIIPATHRDFSYPMGRYPDDFSTPDFDVWHFIEVCKALAAGEAVPAEVIQDHALRFYALLDGQPDAPVILPMGLDSLEIEAAGEAVAAANDMSLVDQLVFQLECGKMPDIGLITRSLDGSVSWPALDGNLAEAIRRSGYVVPLPSQLEIAPGQVFTVASLGLATDDALSIFREAWTEPEMC